MKERDCGTTPAEHIAAFEIRARLSSVYCAAFIEGLGASQLSTTQAVDVAIRLLSRWPDDVHVQRAFCDLVGKRERDPIPNDAIRALEQVALTSADPSPEREKERLFGDSQVHDPHHLGINSVRGRAVRVLLARAHDEPAFDATDAMAKFAVDPSSAVRSCLMELLPAYLAAHRNAAISAFETAIEGRPELLESAVTQRFVYWAMRRDLDQVLPAIRAMIASQNGETATAGARLATLAWFEGPDLKPLYDQCANGCPALRRGAIEVLARNVDSDSLRCQCLDELSAVMKGPVAALGAEICDACRHLPAIPDERIKRFVRDCIASDAINGAPEAVSEYAERAATSEPQFAIETGERLFVKYGDSIADFSQRAGMVDKHLVNVSMSVYASQLDAALRSRAMGLFESALRVGSHFALKALEAADR